MLRSNDLLETVRLKQRAAVMLYAAFAINNGGKVAGVLATKPSGRRRSAISSDCRL